MKYGIYYAYWEREWSNQFFPYIEKCSQLGFDVLEIGCGAFGQMDDDFFCEMRELSEKKQIVLTGGYGPSEDHNMANTEPEKLKKTFAFYEDIFRKMKLAGMDRIGGALYSYWPVDYKKMPEKEKDLQNSIRNMRYLADIAVSYGVTLNMEVLNRFEGYLLNVSEEAVNYVREVGRDNVKVMLDTFHMNIEEDSIPDAVRIAGDLLGHIHIGEANRKCPGPAGRIDWEALGIALKDIGYKGYVVMEPFVRMGGQVGKDVRLWRQLSRTGSEEELDRTASESVSYIRSVMG
ncbi:MAG TPA: sugar phosphate isomerase/epimerase [Candidatus Eisenbergiella pullicola]|nr:sugar phosphate isomerase/epimerase [Candidatus Eisenbergiella pullicola]